MSKAPQGALCILGGRGAVQCICVLVQVEPAGGPKAPRAAIRPRSNSSWLRYTSVVDIYGSIGWYFLSVETFRRWAEYNAPLNTALDQWKEPRTLPQ